MNILILNWRDIKNPKSGGAEVLTHEIAKRWVRGGHRVTFFSSIFPNSKKKEIIDGVLVIRKGLPDARFLFSSVHFQAFLYYLRNKGRLDVVLDEIHGVPFFTPWYASGKKVVLICEVAGDLWIKMFGHFFGVLGRVLEQVYTRFIYRNIPFLTISNSTKQELIKEGVNADFITVLPMGLTIPKEIKKVKRENNPTLIFVGRISKTKGIEDAIEAFSLILKEEPNIKLWIVGWGDEKYVSYLKEMTKKLNVLPKITFWGFVSEKKKFELMGRAHFLIAPSVKEGWGLIVPEAGFVGTPSIGYNVSGLKEVIKDGKTGYLAHKNNPSELAKIIAKAFQNKNKYKKMRKNAKKLSLSYNWDNTARVALNVLKE